MHQVMLLRKAYLWLHALRLWICQPVAEDPHGRRNSQRGRMFHPFEFVNGQLPPAFSLFPAHR